MQKQPPAASVARLPKYLAYLKVKLKQQVRTISSTQIAEDLRLYPVQVRKDLQLASDSGKPKVGYPLETLIADLERFLGYHNERDAFLVGAGRLGRALLGYPQFAEFGLSLLAAFDVDPALIGTEIEGKPVFSIEKLPDLARRMGVQIGILTVPESAAQAACDKLIEGGVRAIWNFTVALLQVPEGTIIHNENLAVSLAALSKKLMP